MVQSNLQSRVFVVLYGLSVITAFTCGFHGSNLIAFIAEKKMYGLLGILQKTWNKKH